MSDEEYAVIKAALEWRAAHAALKYERENGRAHPLFPNAAGALDLAERALAAALGCYDLARR